ncbi:hypothetical protein GCM10020367_16480 [Streptomyces sannanensis]|uniref:Integral membrane protein n=1 Tax=Streptomyces sannanensis TaxID=285536 RepID=A0ABP6S7U7_9ACTN
MDASGTQLRALRAALFTALVVTLSAAAHVLLSHVPLPMATVAAVSVAVFVIAYALAGRERGYWSIASVLVPLELAADTVFTTGQHACYGPAGGPVEGSLRSVGVDVFCGGSAGSVLPGVADPKEGVAALLNSADPALPWLLLAVHVSVGLLSAAWLRQGEASVARMLRAVAAFAFRPLLVAVAATAAPHRAVHPGVRPADRGRAFSRTLLLVHSVGRRGPPCSALVLA